MESFRIDNNKTRESVCRKRCVCACYRAVGPVYAYLPPSLLFLSVLVTSRTMSTKVTTHESLKIVNTTRKLMFFSSRHCSFSYFYFASPGPWAHLISVLRILSLLPPCALKSEPSKSTVSIYIILIALWIYHIRGSSCYRTILSGYQSRRPSVLLRMYPVKSSDDGNCSRRC